MTARLHERVAEALGEPRAGLAVSAVVAGETVHVSRGEARPGGRPVTPDTIFELGSVTKVFTGIMLAACVRDGTVTLDDRLSRHLPRHRASFDPTLRELATHASGLPNVTRGLDPREVAFALGVTAHDPHASLTRAAFEEALARTRARRRRFRYSSLGVALLGEALAAAAGRPYETLLRERLLAPLGMVDTVVDPRSLLRLATGASALGRERPPFDDRLLVPAGGLRSTARDMTAFVRANLEPEGELGAALELALAPARRVSRGFAIGLCWLIVRSRGRVLHWHNGGTWGFRSFVALDRDVGGGVAVLSNRARSVDRLGLRLVERLPQ